MFSFLDRIEVAWLSMDLLSKEVLSRRELMPLFPTPSRKVSNAGERVQGIVTITQVKANFVLVQVMLTECSVVRVAVTSV